MTSKQPKTILILGGTSHIAKGLIARFLTDTSCRIEWFGRSALRMETFLTGAQLSGNIRVHENYDGFYETDGDVLINCVGSGTPSELKGDYTLWFTVLEKYDNLCLDYLRQVKPKSLYIDFSSGAVYGRNQSEAVYSINPNVICNADFYALAKLYSEAKHRAFSVLNIIDIRIFSYFSRYADLSSGYLMTDIIRSIVNDTPLKTSSENVVRDYISPDDLFSLIECCMAQPKINAAFDAYSLKSVSKQEIIDVFRQDFNLKTDVSTLNVSSINSTPSVYLPHIFNAKALGYSPVHSSLSALRHEAEIILGGN